MIALEPLVPFPEPLERPLRLLPPGRAVPEPRHGIPHAGPRRRRRPEHVKVFGLVLPPLKLRRSYTELAVDVADPILEAVDLFLQTAETCVVPFQRAPERRLDVLLVLLVHRGVDAQQRVDFITSGYEPVHPGPHPLHLFAQSVDQRQQLASRAGLCVESGRLPDPPRLGGVLPQTLRGLL